MEGHPILPDRVPPDDDRRFGAAVVDAGVPFEVASAYLLGHDLSSLLNDTERQALDAFVARVRDAGHPSATQGMMTRLGPPSWNQDPDQLLARVDAFMEGLGR